MKNLKIISLTILLTTGFFFPSCDKEQGPTDSCDGVVFLNYFDVQGLEVFSYYDLDNGEKVVPLDIIAFEELDKINIDYQVDYTTFNPPKQDWSFSLIPSAVACSYIPGGQGSKEEAIVNFSIITINDFDDDHLANSDIKDLFDYFGSYWERLQNPIPLQQFLDEQTENLKEEDMILALKKAPELDQEFRIKVIMELSTGELYEFETEPIFITP